MATQKKLVPIYTYETGTLAFATLNLVVAISLCVLAVGSDALNDFFEYFQISVSGAGGLVLPLLFLSFNMLISVLLFIGILRKTPVLILTYFWFGVAVGSLSGCVLLYAVFLSIYFEMPATVWRAGVIAFYTVYALILTMIFKTWQKLTRTQEEKGGIKIFLVESKNEFMQHLLF